MIKPKPISISAKASESIRAQLNKQERQTSVPKSADPKNFPVFDIRAGKKVLIYVPNHVVEGENGPELRMDKPLLHDVKSSNSRFSKKIRCSSGIELTDENGNVIFDGTCPLCEGISVPWDLANATIKSKCEKLGLNAQDVENEQVKSVRREAFSARAIKETRRYYTFPIVVFETVEDDGKTMAMDPNGKPIMTPMWYTISEDFYKEKWEATFEGMEDEPTHPGGHFFTLSYEYDTKGKPVDKMLAGKALKVIARRIKSSEKLAAFLDNATAEWTPEKAMETVIANQLYSNADLQNMTDDALAGPRSQLALINAGPLGNTGSTGFNLTAPSEEPKALGDSSTVMDETDEDIDLG